ncbi:unnamed protein product, partial [Closterium sp. Yama58-4]
MRDLFMTSRANRDIASNIRRGLRETHETVENQQAFATLNAIHSTRRSIGGIAWHRRAATCYRVRARAGGMEALKQKGNEAFKKGQFSAAALAYRRALEAAAESGEAPRETASLHSNLS